MKPSIARDVARIAAVTFAMGCGGAPAPAPAAPSLPLGPATVAPAAPPPKAEAGPRAPEGLALLVRVNDPEQLAREIVSILPPNAASAVAALDPKQLVMMLLGKRLGDVVDLTQPIDVASVGHEPSFVVSLAVKPEAEARLGDGLALHEEGGLIHIGKSDDGRTDTSRMGACAFTAAAGRASLRLVCASDAATLESSAKYLARTVASDPFDADARVTVPGRILRDKRDATTKAIGDAASARLGTALVDRFVEEIDRVDADLRFAGTRVELSFDLRLTGRESMLSRVLVPKSRPAPPSRAFYRLPGDSLLAFHTTGALPEDIGALRAVLAENVESKLVQDGYRPSDVRGVRERLEGLLLTGGPLVLAMGVASGREGSDKALAAFDGATAKTPAGTKAEAQLRAALVPWMIAEVEEPPERWTQGLRDLIRRAEEAERNRTPGSKASTPSDPDGDHLDVRAGTLDPTSRLPKDALHLEVLITPRRKGSRPNRKGHLFVVPKGSATWLGYSEDSTAITSRLRTAIDDTTDAGTLAKSAEAAALRARPALAAGLGSLAGLGLLAGRTSTYDDLRSMVRTSARLAALGSRGTEMVTWTASGDPSPASVHATLQVQASRQTAVDLVHLLGL
jgi:hypothetical protein